MHYHRRLIGAAACVAITMCCAGTTQAQSFPGEAFTGNEDQLARQMAELIIDVSQRRYPEGPIKRFNQVKSLGCFNGKFEVKSDVPEALRHGLFAQPGRYSASARFASASTTDDREKDLRGLSIRVYGVQGDVVWGQPGQQDFVLNSYPVLFADTPETFEKFIRAQADDALLSFFLNPFDSHIGALMILLKARDHHTSPFDMRFWSTTPFQLGPEQAVKYSVQPCSSHKSTLPDELSANYLRAAMHTHLNNSHGCFDFMVQPRTDPSDMPIEDASVEWDEQDSPFVPVARLTFEQQEFMSREALEACEAVSFNPWQALNAHKPIGRMNYVRREIYTQLAVFREQQNTPDTAQNGEQ